MLIFLGNKKFKKNRRDKGNYFINSSKFFVSFSHFILLHSDINKISKTIDLIFNDYLVNLIFKLQILWKGLQGTWEGSHATVLQ